MNPQFGPVGGGYSITLKGKNFINLTQFSKENVCVFQTVNQKFSEKELRKVVFISSKEIHCPVPEIFGSGVVVKVGISNNGGSKVTFAENTFTFYQMNYAFPLSGPASSSYFFFKKFIK